MTPDRIILELTPLEAASYFEAAGNTVEHPDMLENTLDGLQEELAARRAHRKLRRHLQLARRRAEHR